MAVQKYKMTNNQPYFSFSIPYKMAGCNDFLQKYGILSPVKIVQNERVWFVESSGFVNLAQYKPIFGGLFIDIFAKNCILISDVSFRVKMQTHTTLFRRNT